MRVRHKILLGASTVLTLAVASATMDSMLAPPGPFEQIQLPAPAVPTPGVTITPAPIAMPAAPVPVTTGAISPAPTAGCEPDWKKRMRRLSDVVGIKSAESQVICCPCYAGSTVDSSNIAKNTTTVGQMTSIVSTIGKAVSLFTKLSSAIGSKGGNQFGSIAMPLAIPPPNLSAVTAIAAPSAGTVAQPALSSVSTAQAWIVNTLTTSATDAATTQGIAARRAAAVVEASRYGYGLALNQRADPTLAAENAAFYNLGNSANTSIAQVGALGNAAASLSSDAQHLEVMEEAALEIAAAQALASSNLGGGQ